MGPDRKSMYDSLLLGCIPVLFSKRSFALSPLHWDASWKANSSVLINYSEYMSGQINLVSHLESFLGSYQGYNNNNHNGKTVESMQHYIAENAESVQYSLDDSTHDAFSR